MTAINFGPDFRATGKGYHNKIPGVQANAHTGNAVLHNRGLPDKHAQHQMWLFCTGVETGWTLSGSKAQGPDGATFYPRHIAQDEIAISAVVANQYQYDRIVEFVQEHHRVATRTGGGYEQKQNTSSKGGIPVDFRLAPYRIPIARRRNGEIVWRYIHHGMHYEGYITTIKAGHERFKNAPTVDLIFKVSNDFADKNVLMSSLFNAELRGRYISGFGPRVRFTPFEGPQADPIGVEDPDSFFTAAEMSQADGALGAGDLDGGALGAGDMNNGALGAGDLQ